MYLFSLKLGRFIVLLYLGSLPYVESWIQPNNTPNRGTWMSSQWYCWITAFLCLWGFFLYLSSMRWIIFSKREFFIFVSPLFFLSSSTLLSFLFFTREHKNYYFFTFCCWYFTLISVITREILFSLKYLLY